MDENELGIERQIAWLKDASPDDWHRAVLDFNWDWEIDALFWIARQPECDKATALTMFWLGQPAYFLGLCVEKGGSDDHQDPVWALLKFIAQRINAKGYVRSKIAYEVDDHTHQDYNELVDNERQLAHPPVKTHPDMHRAIRGRQIINDVDFYRRYPEQFHGTVLIELPKQGLLDRPWSVFGRLWRS